MKIQIVYPRWPKMPNQTQFHLPPHGPVCFAAAIPDGVELAFCDENIDSLAIDGTADLVAISTMLTCQIPRAWEIGDECRARGIPVIIGGIGAMLHREETMPHVDSIFVGEAEGWMEEVLADLKKGQLKKVYDHFHDFPEAGKIGTARRSILNRERYNFKGVQMVDLVHASRGCRYACYPCCTEFLGGRNFRPRPIDAVVAELESIDNDRVFFVDNSLAQDDQWEMDLFRAIAPLKKKWISHPIKDDEKILDLAAEAGCWYVYQAIFDTSDLIRNRIKRLKERNIGVEGTILLGLDEHDEDYIKRLVDFLLEINLDLAEFTVLTPFPHTRARAELEKQGRIMHSDWIRYTAAEVVFRPARMSPAALEKMHQYAWDTFYAGCSRELKMVKLFMNVMKKQTKDGTYRRPRIARNKQW
ncbi:MAG: cobalamin-dependent protein [bacterium]